jgi:replicative DNA helicase
MTGLPHDLQAEAAVLGSILLSSLTIFTASELLEPNDFYLEHNRTIFRAMLEMDPAGIDEITLPAELRRREKLDTDMILHLQTMTAGLPRCANVRHYAKLIRDKSALRRIIQVAQETVSRGLELDADLETVIERLSSVISGIDTRNDGYVAMSALAAEGYKRLEERAKSRGIPGSIKSGLVCLDSQMGGFAPGSLVLIAGRPSQGKSSLCAGIALDAAMRQGKAVGIATLEMTQLEVYDRMVCSEASIDLSHLTQGLISKEQWSYIYKASTGLAGSRIWVDESTGISIRQLQAKAERLKTEHQIDLLIVDYLGLLKGTEKGANRVQVVSEISAGLKELAKQLHIPVIAASQLNRDPAKGDREPILSDLRDSGSLEQDADVVVLIHRENTEDNPVCVPVNLFIAKNRNGKTGKVKALFHRNFTRFVDGQSTS